MLRPPFAWIPVVVALLALVGCAPSAPPPVPPPACVPGTRCTPPNVCETGKTLCTGSGAACEDTGVPVADATACGSGLICFEGACMSCVPGAICTPANACDVGTLACTGTPACVDTGIANGDGSLCGGGLVCHGGACGACVAGASCVPWTNACHTGALDCTTSAEPTCNDTYGVLPEGTPCAYQQICEGGFCTACAGISCTPAQPCDEGSSCPSGSVSCSDTGLAVVDGMACGSGHVCQAGACVTCQAGVSCAGITVTTLAGTGWPGLMNGPGGVAELWAPAAVAVDVAGNVYVADTKNCVIRRIDLTGNVTTFAGDGTCGFAEGAPGTGELDGPAGLAFDTSGNLYVSDQANQRIRLVDRGGNLSTYAGSGLGAYLDGPAATAEFYDPAGLAFDAAGNLYVANALNAAIREITPSGGVTTVAGGSTGRGYLDGPKSVAQFDEPLAVAVDAAGNLYVADAGNNRIRKVSPAGDTMTVAGSVVEGFADGPAPEAAFYSPSDVKLDAAGNLYVADLYDHRIRRIDRTGAVRTLAGFGLPGYVDGPALAARFSSPGGLALDTAGDVYVADTGNNMIREILVP